MSKPKISSAVAVFALVASAGASAGDRYYGGHQYRADPQIRLGIDILWGGAGYAPRPPVMAYPVHYVPVEYVPVYYAPPHYAPHYDGRHYDGRHSGHGKGKGHRKHRHR